MLDPSLLKGFIFDFDGTLADTLPLCYEAFRKAAEPFHGRLLTNEEIAATFGPSEEGSVRVLAPESPDVCLDYFYRHYEDLHEMVPDAFPGIHDTLTALKSRGYRLGIVTGKGLRSLEISIKTLRLEGLFDSIEAGCPEGPCKPQSMKTMLEEWNLEGPEVLCVGDSPSDIEAAHAMGSPAVAAAWSDPNRRERLEPLHPDLMFESFHQFADWLAAHGIIGQISA